MYTTLKLTALLFVCGALAAQTYSRTSNFSADLYGATDTRPGCYGLVDEAQWNVTFDPPAGYSVRVLSIHGDFIAWIKTLPGDPMTPLESIAGVLLGIQSTPQQSGVPVVCDWCSAVLRPTAARPRPPAVVQGTTMLYIQDSVAQLTPKTRAVYDLPNVNQLLQSDNKLLITVAAWLNTTGKPIHVEPTFTVIFRLEKNSAAQTN